MTPELFTKSNITCQWGEKIALSWFMNLIHTCITQWNIFVLRSNFSIVFVFKHIEIQYFAILVGECVSFYV